MKISLLRLVLILAASTASATDNRPLNVLFLMTDQHHAQALGCSGSPVVKTPNLDRLAAGGARFVNSYCVVPYCSPTRAAIVTGRYPSSLGIGRNIGKELDREDPLRLREPCETYLHRLAAKGYHCHQLGKWHVGDPAELNCFPDAQKDEEAVRKLIAERNRTAGDQRFDSAQRPGDAERIGNVWLCEAASAAHRRLQQEKNKPKQDVGIIGRSVLKPEFSVESILADYCIDLLQRHRDEPFAITYSVSPPHAANVVPAPFYDQYDPARLPLPATWADRPDWLKHVFSARMGAIFGEPGIREYLRCYYGQVTMMDWCMGRILNALEELGLASRTLVVFTSDHGNMLGQHGMIEKGVGALYDDLMRVPLILRLPGAIPSGIACPSPASSVDLGPTILDYLAAPPLAQAHGQSLRPGIHGRDTEDRPVFGESGDLEKGNVSRMIRTPHWKLTLTPHATQSLFDLNQDPGETRNLATDPATASIRATLSAQLLAHMSQIGDPAVSRFQPPATPAAK